MSPLIANPNPERLFLLVAFWHHAMSLLLFKLDQLFIVLVPELVVLVQGVDAVIFPREPDFLQTYLSILSHFLVVMKAPLITNPLP
jgi:hypothetical protein